MAKISITTDEGSVIYEAHGPNMSIQAIKQAIEKAEAQDKVEAINKRNAEREGPWVEVKPETVTRYQPGWGVDHGIAGEVLMRKGSTKLVWRKGHSWKRGICEGYYAAQLELHDIHIDTGLSTNSGKKIKRGGRLSKKVFAELEETLKKAFQVETLPPLKQGRTYVHVDADEFLDEDGKVKKVAKRYPSSGAA